MLLNIFELVEFTGTRIDQTKIFRSIWVWSVVNLGPNLANPLFKTQILDQIDWTVLPKCSPICKNFKLLNHPDSFKQFPFPICSFFHCTGSVGLVRGWAPSQPACEPQVAHGYLYFIKYQLSRLHVNIENLKDLPKKEASCEFICPVFHIKYQLSRIYWQCALLVIPLNHILQFSSQKYHYFLQA